MSFFNKKDEVVSTEGKEATESPVWSSQLSSAMSDARKSGVGSATGTKTKSKAPKETSSRGNLSAKDEEQIVKLFNPDAWRPIVKAPFAVGQALTGRECWALSKSEEDTLAVSTSTSMEYVAITDPKMLALAMCAVTWTIIITEKFILNARERAKEDLLNPKPKETVGVHSIK